MSTACEVLLACYNGSRYLQEQLDSLFCQSAPFQLLVRDDNSTDNTLQILHTYKKRLILLPTEQNLGVIGNFERLLAASSAPYLFFCDQDDLWHPQKIALSLAKIQEMETLYGKKTPCLVHTDLSVVTETGKLLQPSFWQWNGFDIKNPSLASLLCQNQVTGCAMVINRALRNLVLPFPQKAVMHDWWCALVAALFGKIGTIDQPLIRYRQHSANCVGAQRASLLKVCQKGLSTFRLRQQKRYQQAEALIDRFKDSLPSLATKTVNAYLSLPALSRAERRQIMVQEGFWRASSLQNGLCWILGLPAN